MDDRRHQGASQRETDWEQVFEAVSDPMAILTPDYHVVRANSAYVTWLHTTRGRCEGHTCFVHGETSGARSSPCMNCPLPQTVATGRPGFVRQVRMEQDELGGAPVAHVYETWTYPVRGADGSVERVVEIVKDVTERERLAQVTREAEALREADRLKSELLGTVSHELRSPLASIKGYAATLIKHEKRLSAAERHEFLQAIVGASDRLEAVIDRMLEMSQLETGGLRLERASVNIARLVREAVREAERQAAERTPALYRFIFDTRILAGRGIEPLVCGDRRRLRDVLDQVLQNAVTYSPEGGDVVISLRPYATPVDLAAEGTAAEVVEIEVRDGGIGIPAEHLDRVFERFHRVDTRLTREAEGLGLGLAIARRVVELHGGSIWAESDLGNGSTFHIVLPLHEQVSGAHEMERDADDADDGEPYENQRTFPKHAGAASCLQGSGITS